MKPGLRLALPPLALIESHSIIDFALFDRAGRLLRSGEERLDRLAQAVPTRRVQAVLHPGDAIVATVDLPPLAARRMDAAVQSRVEPMALSDLAELCIAYGPRAPDGTVTVAWTDRPDLLRAWRLLHEAGLEVDAIVPWDLARPAADPEPERPLSLPADARWRTALPSWSLARPEWRPRREHRRWNGPMRWVFAAALVWIVGLNLYAAQLRSEQQALRDTAEKAVRNAFPAIPAIIDPLRQARMQLDTLRLDHGLDAPDDFLPLAVAAARLLDFAGGRVTALRYQDGWLELRLADGTMPPADEKALQARASAEALLLRKSDQDPLVWRIGRDGTTLPTETNR